ncbi:MAG: serine hydrolase domain-containing protein [Cyclobacteriaceae bacterium]
MEVNKETKRIMLGIIVAFTVIYYQPLKAEGPSKIEEKIIKAFNKEVGDESIHNAFLSVSSESNNIGINEVYGMEETETPFYTASLAKTFTATLIGILVDENKLEFDDKISGYLPGDLISGLHVLNGEDHTSKLTIAHLLNHSSGLPDYFEDEPSQGVNMMTMLFTKPDRTWTPEELIVFTKENFTPKFVPGSGFHYTDTEYVLLALIIEKVTGLSYDQALSDYIFKPLAMNSSYINLHSKPLKGDVGMAPLYAETAEISGFTSLSADWGGGGLVSTSEDLYQFMSALIEGELVSDATWTEMNQYTPESRGTYYGYGLRKWNLKELFPTLPDITLIGHSGSTGSFMYYSPELDTYFTGTFNQTEMIQQHIRFLVKLMVMIKKDSKK